MLLVGSFFIVGGLLDIAGVSLAGGEGSLGFAGGA